MNYDLILPTLVTYHNLFSFVLVITDQSTTFLDTCEVKGCGAVLKIDFKRDISEDILVAYEKKVVFIKWVGTSYCGNNAENSL